MDQRPLSPHLSVYRWGYTMSLSILHRASGLALVATLVGFVWWLFLLGRGPEAYAAWVPLWRCWPVRVVEILALLALAYHFCAGIRHLAWDWGFGFERRQARTSAVVMLLAVVILFAALLCWWFYRGAA